MGEVTVMVEVANAADEAIVAGNLVPGYQTRSERISMVVDTGAVMVVLPQDLVERLGLRVLRKAVVTYADERRDERPVAGPLTVRIEDRATTVDCIVGPPTSEPLLGQIPLEAMDLMVDCTRRKLVPHPESPYLPMLKLK